MGPETVLGQPVFFPLAAWMQEARNLAESSWGLSSKKATVLLTSPNTWSSSFFPECLQDPPTSISWAHVTLQEPPCYSLPSVSGLTARLVDGLRGERAGCRVEGETREAGSLQRAE